MIQKFLNQYWQRQKKTKGSFLVDVLVSLGILMMGMTASYSVVSQALISNTVNKNKIIAINLAREGMEAIHLVRGTNWLRYGSKKRICWNFWNNTDENHYWSNSSDDTCEEDVIRTGQNQHPIGIANRIDSNSGSYIIGDDIKIKSYLAVLDPTNYDWTLVENFYYINLANPDVLNQEPTCITQQDRDEGKEDPLLVSSNDSCSDDPGMWGERRFQVGNITSRLYKDSITGLYTHQTEGNVPTNFFREIIISYPLGTDDDFFPENNSWDNQILVTVLVWYRGHGGNYKKIILETELTDYLERTNWTD
jgi:Tfp pilus assembly protein PilV